MASPQPTLAQLNDIRKRTSLKPSKSAVLTEFARDLKAKLAASRATSKHLEAQFREVNSEITLARWDHADKLVAL